MPSVKQELFQVKRIAVATAASIGTLSIRSSFHCCGVSHDLVPCQVVNQ